MLHFVQHDGCIESAKMKKRLRKKKYQGEFTTVYWKLIFEFRFDLSRDRLNDIRQALFAFLDANNLSWDGWSGPPRAIFYIETGNRCGLKRYGIVTEAHKQLVTAWLLKLPEVARVVDRPLIRFFG